MLIRLLRRFLYQARWVLLGIAALQFVQTAATLYLPRLSADIIDKGISTGDSGYIWSRGLVMLAATMVQVAFAIGAIYFGSRTAMRFGRDVRAALFQRVSELSVQDVSRTGAASLISRITNDVQQVQILVLTSCTLLLGAPIMVIGGTVLAIREDVGVSVVLLVSIPVLMIAIGILVTNLVPRFRKMQVQIDSVNQVLREQITGIRVVRAFVRERRETERFRGVNTELTTVATGT
ncbi:MAG: transporter related, partial [Ilumatobacteraceae bacterium]|nr:transporter related [Ilumatobacteraceae bacterium]